MPPLVTIRQLATLEKALDSDRWFVDEQLWSFLTASLIAESTDRFVPLFCDDRPQISDHFVVACEAEPLAPRLQEGNTVLDITFGDLSTRLNPARTGMPGLPTLAGIEYGVHRPESWVCFVEAKYLSDCASKVTNDPRRNQLTRVIENLLCFQRDGESPSHLYFVLLTPRIFKRPPHSRLYGYKMDDYQNEEAIIADIEACTFDKRANRGFCFPDIRERIKALNKPRWVTFEDVFQEAGLGDDSLDIVAKPGDLGHIKDAIQARLLALRG